jgi:hypothetical protein
VPVRTTPGDVKSLLASNFDAGRNSVATLGRYIARATKAVDRVVACAAARRYVLDADEQRLLEETLAAHFYTKTDPVYASRGELGASGSFVRDPKTPEPYKAMAIEQDPSGCVAALLSSEGVRQPGAFWTGKTESERIDYRDRQ